MPRMILLGTGTGVPDADRTHTHMVWDGPGGPLLIDAGGSTYQRLLAAGIDPQQLAGMILTHSHCDHINGLPGLLFSIALAGRQETFPIYGPASALELAQRIVETFQLDALVPPVQWNSVEPGDDIALTAGWRVRTALTQHSRTCLALRFEPPSTEPALTYSADTEPCPAVAALAQGTHTLIHEATTPEPSPSHTSPRQAGEVAAAAGAARLLLVHYSPRWTMPEAQALAAIRAGGFNGIAEIGRDMQIVEI